MKILIIEDEPKTGKFLKKGLTEAGFVADVAADGLHLALTESYDLVVLDVMLPGIDGWESWAKCGAPPRSYASAFH